MLKATHNSMLSLSISEPVCEIERLRRRLAKNPLFERESRPHFSGSPKPTDPELFDEFFGARVSVRYQPKELSLPVSYAA